MFYGEQGSSGPIGGANFAVDMFQMGPDGSFGYEESPGHLPPIETFSYQTEHLNLSISEPGRPFLLAGPLSVGAIYPTQVFGESLESIREEPTPYFLAHHIDRLIQLAAWAVGPIVSKFIEAVSHGDDPCPQRYLRASKPTIVATAIHRLVMCCYEGNNRLQRRDFGQDTLRVVRVEPYLLALGLSEGALGLVQHEGRYGGHK